MHYITALRRSILFSMAIVGIAGALALITESIHLIMILGPLQASLAVVHLYLASRHSRHGLRIIPAPPPWFFRLRGPLPTRIVYFLLMAIVLFGVAYRFHWQLGNFVMALLPLAIVLLSVDNTRSKRRRRRAPVTPYRGTTFHPSAGSAPPYDERSTATSHGYGQGHQLYEENGFSSQTILHTPVQSSPDEGSQFGDDRYEQLQTAYPEVPQP
jgi:hypothetical protein